MLVFAVQPIPVSPCLGVDGRTSLMSSFFLESYQECLARLTGMVSEMAQGSRKK